MEKYVLSEDDLKYVANVVKNKLRERFLKTGCSECLNDSEVAYQMILYHVKKKSRNC